MSQYVNILRTAVQIPDMHALAEIQSHFRTVDHNGKPAVIATTRRMPKRANDVLNGGSMYWIIKNAIQCRQEIIDIKLIEDPEGNHCRIYMNPQIIRLAPRKKRAVQGWRYLEPKDEPKDLGQFNPDEETLPPELERELRKIGVV